MATAAPDSTHSTKTTKAFGPSIRVKSIGQVDDRTLGITWTDGKQSKLDVVELRRRCPCATCIDEWTHEPLLKPNQIPESIRPLKVESVGQYALTIHFSDGHKTGIYTFNSLHQL